MILPGPNKPTNFDSFLSSSMRLPSTPLALAVVVSALFPRVSSAQSRETNPSLRFIDFTDGLDQTYSLRYYLLFVGGDMPAVAMVMHMKGHSAEMSVPSSSFLDSLFARY